MKYNIFTISDGTGRTAKQIINVVLTQFLNIQTNMILYSIVRNCKKIDEIIEESKNYENVIFAHTIVDIKLKSYIIDECNKANIKSIDLIGSVIDKMSLIFENNPSQNQGLYYQTNEEYFKRIDAVQFAFKHDDGANIEEVDKAEIILLGVSITL